MLEVEYKVDNTITHDCKVETHTEELDFALYHDILGKENIDKAYEEDGVNSIYKGKDYQNTPVKIEVLKEMLLKLEEKGCNYVSIDYHCDHIEYDICGIDVHKATEEEIEAEKEKETNEELETTKKLREAAQEYIKKAENIESNFSSRVKAMEWWNELSDIKRTDLCQHFPNGINWKSLTGSQIEKLWNSFKLI